MISNGPPSKPFPGPQSPGRSLKVLLIRFSSFGDVVQSLSLPERLADLAPPGQKAEIHWATKSEFVPLIETHPFVQKVWALPRKASFRSLWKLCQTLSAERFDHVYDAHNSLRSRMVCALVRAPHFLRKSQFRLKRFLLFNFRINLYQKPYSGQRDLLMPLKAWGLSTDAPAPPQLFLKPATLTKVATILGPFSRGAIALAPSAAYPLKRWPVPYWQELIRSTDLRFVILGGPEDHFIESLSAMAPERVLNMAGRLSLEESAAAISFCRALVSNDTGLLHVGEQLGLPSLALMGPAPFGFPSRARTRILNMNLSCQPCSKHGQGPCTNGIYQFCLRGISVQRVIRELAALLEAHPSLHGENRPSGPVSP